MYWCLDSIVGDRKRMNCIPFTLSQPVNEVWPNLMLNRYNPEILTSLHVLVLGKHILQNKI